MFNTDDKRGFAVSLISEESVSIPVAEVEGHDELARKEAAMRQARIQGVGPTGDFDRITVTGADRDGDVFRVGFDATAVKKVNATDAQAARDAVDMDPGAFPEPRAIDVRPLVTDLKASIRRGSVDVRVGRKRRQVDSERFAEYKEENIIPELDGRTVGQSDRRIGRIWFGENGEVLDHELREENRLSGDSNKPAVA